MKRCLNLADSSAILQLREAHQDLSQLSQLNQVPLPDNGESLRARNLDCAVTNFLHRKRQDNDLPAYDTVRGLFWEGAPIYEGAGVREQNHIQICVRDRAYILGYFRPVELNWL